MTATEYAKNVFQDELNKINSDNFYTNTEKKEIAKKESIKIFTALLSCFGKNDKENENYIFYCESLEVLKTF